ncbi:MAG: hypothetical protein ACUVXJ_11380, partial [Phycisphaerae bacterium]
RIPIRDQATDDSHRHSAWPTLPHPNSALPPRLGCMRFFRRAPQPGTAAGLCRWFQRHLVFGSGGEACGVTLQFGQAVKGIHVV